MALLSFTEFKRADELFSIVPEEEVCRLLAARVRALRTARGESQKDFAKRAFIAERTYKRFERDGKVTLENFIHIVKALNCAKNLQYLFPLPPQLVKREEIGSVSPEKILELARESHVPLRTLLKDAPKK